ncbi:UDP-glucose 4-epimerase GalE [Tissierella praeacuta]|uniref:UDP-glucose 4-epimerase GalE n=1 Tax=Tissierella praeacuta TaxID=43131 RepID=UPI0033411CC5
MAILVTGGTGYIGSHTCVELLSKNYNVIIIDNFSNSKPEILDKIKIITNKTFIDYNIDLLNKDALKKVFIENKIEAVIHFAGYKAVGESVENPLKYYKNNLIGTLNLIEAMSCYNVKNIVFSSSATVYGNPKELPIKEDFPLSVINPYGRTKLMIEEILRDLYKSDNGWNMVILRYFNPIGAHDSGLIGEEPNGIPNNLMPYIIQVAAGKREYLNIYGNDYSTHDGTGIRDYLHVVDLAKGHLKALKRLNDNKGLDIYNLGTGKGYSVLEVVRAFEDAVNIKIPFNIVGRRLGDIAECYADVNKAKKELDWMAKKSLRTMCQDSWKFQLVNSNY